MEAKTFSFSVISGKAVLRLEEKQKIRWVYFVGG
jgi:hypothetical protein